jgi:hypothetical protein
LAFAREPAKVLKARRALFHHAPEQIPPDRGAGADLSFKAAQYQFARELTLDPAG